MFRCLSLMIAVSLFLLPQAFAKSKAYRTSIIDPFVYTGSRIGFRPLAPAFDAHVEMAAKNAVGLFQNFHFFSYQVTVDGAVLNVEGITSLHSHQSRVGRRHVLMYYGVGGNIGRILREENFLTQAQRLLGPDTDISIIDHPGYGKSEGAANELTIIASGVKALDVLDSIYALNGETILLGHSLGSAVAIQVAAVNPKCKALVLLNPFYSLETSASVAIVLTFDRYKSYLFAPNIHIPVFIEAGAKDTVNRAKFGRQLASVFPQDTSEYLENPYDHVTPILEQGDVLGFELVWRPIIEFLAQI